MKLKVLLIGILSVSAFAHEGATGVVKDRMDAMSAMADANKSLVAMSRGRTDFDLAMVQQSAQIIAEHSGESLLELFPEDSLSDVSEAKAEIWEQWESFSDYAMNMESSALSLSAITSEDEFSAAYREMSRNCGGCHKKFRAKR